MTTFRALLARPSALAALIVLAGVAVLTAGGGLLAPYDPLAQNTSDVLAGPSAAHWLGTDYLGRDILSRLLAGTRLSVLAALEAVLIALALGTGAALIAVFTVSPVRWCSSGSSTRSWRCRSSPSRWRSARCWATPSMPR